MFQSGLENIARLDMFIRLLKIGLSISCIFLTVIKATDKEAALRFLKIEPTVLFVKAKEGLSQQVKIYLLNDSKTKQVQLEVWVGKWHRSQILGDVPKGESNFEIFIPDLSAPTPAEFILKVGQKILDRYEFELEPQRHWEVFMVPISHHDLGYTDAIENIYLKHDSYYADVIRFCEETDNFPEESKYRYTAEATWSIKHFIENQPQEIVAQLVKYIREGRIEVHAFLGNEITGLCGHEELIRLMYPSFQLKKKYGINVEVCSITDVAGLSWGIPTVLAGAGIKYFYGGMPNYGVFFKNDKTAYYLNENGNDFHQFWDESVVLPYGRQQEAFRWEGPDGQSVLFYYGGTGGVGCYGCWRPESYNAVLENLPVMLKKLETNGSQLSVVRYGTYGCYDNEAPNILPSLITKEWNSKWAYPRLIVATSSMFFKELEKQCKDVRAFRGELPHTDYVRGVMSTARITSINRQTHDRIVSAEKFATIASVVSNYNYPREVIRQAYDNMLLYDEHTWGLANPSGKIQDWNWNDKSHFALKSAAQAEFILNSSLTNIARSLEIKDKGTRVIVFNPLSFSRTDVVRVEGFGQSGPFEMIDEQTGQKIRSQTIKIDNPRVPAPYAGQRYGIGQVDQAGLIDLVFVAEDVPPIGYKSYWIVPVEQGAPDSAMPVISDTTLENQFYRIILDQCTGSIKSIFDKELKRELVDPQVPYGLNQVIARCSKTLENRTIENVKVRRGQNGPVCKSLIISGDCIGCPEITQEISLYDNVKRIDLANRILKDFTPLWEIYFAFPFKVDDPRFLYEGSDAVVEPLADQFPGSNTCYYAVQHWAKVSDRQMDITLSPIESHLLEFGGLWPCYISPGMHIAVMPTERTWLNSIPKQFSKGSMYAYVMDSNFRTNFSSAQEGDVLFRYSITTNLFDKTSEKSRNFGWSNSNPLIPLIIEGENNGNAGKSGSFIEIDKPNVMVLTFKQAEDSNGFIIRLIECEGQNVNVTVTVPCLLIKKAYLSNVVEENIKVIDYSDHKVSVPVRASGISTIRLETN